jgi:hypothetical protein
LFVLSCGGSALADASKAMDALKPRAQALCAKAGADKADLCAQAAADLFLAKSAIEAKDEATATAAVAALAADVAQLAD